MDLKSYSRWYDYSRARDAMFAATDTAWAPWYVADADDKKRARLNIISHLLSQVPYKPLPHRDVTLPRRQPPAATWSQTCPCGTSRAVLGRGADRRGSEQVQIDCPLDGLRASRPPRGSGRSTGGGSSPV